MKPIKKQAGLTLISWIIIIVFLLFQGVIAMQILPVYMTDQSVKTIIEALPQDLRAKNSSKRDLRLLVMKRLRMNNVYTIKSESIKVKRSRSYNIVTINYEPRGKIIGNLEYIVNFKHIAKVAASKR